MKIEEIIIIVFLFGVSSYAIYYLYNLLKIKNKILNQIDMNNISNINVYQSYAKTINIPPNSNTPKTFTKANQFITLEKLLKHNGINIRLYLAIPSLLVGLGVLGTFVGFSLTVWSIGDILDNSNQLEGMKKLFASVKIAFFSSVAGMFWSFIFSKSEKIQFHNLEEKINERCNQLDETYYQSHDEYIREFIGNIESSITTNISHSFTIINDGFKEKISDLLKEPTETLKIQSENLKKQLINWETSLNEQNKVVIDSTAQLASLPATIKKEVFDINQLFTRNINNSFKIINDNLKEEITDFLKEPTEALKIQSESFEKQLINWETSLNEQNKVVVDSTTLLSSLPVTMKSQLSKITSSFGTLDKNIGVTIGKLTSANTEIDSYIHKWLDVIQLQIHAIKQQEDSIKQNISILAAVPDMAQGLDKVNKTFEKSVKSFQKMETVLTSSMNSIGNSLSQTTINVSQFNQTSKNIQLSIENLSNDINELKIIVDTLNKSITQGLDSTIERRLVKTNNLLNDYFSAIDKLSDKIVNTYISTKNG